MAEMTPLKALFDNDGNPTSLAEFTVADFLRVEDGGTGQVTYSNGQILIGNSSGSLTKTTLTGTSNQIIVTNGDGTITLSLPQSIATSSVPTFNGITINGTGHFTSNVGIGISPARSLHISCTDGLVIPVGTTAQRHGIPLQGEIRYNTTQTTFEGYSGSSWGSLGGVIDVDQDTYVSAETSAGSDNDEIVFHTAGSERGKFCSTGDFNVTNSLIVGGNLTISGTTTTVNTAEMTVDDPNITLNAVGTPTDALANLGGITLLGTTNKTINWTCSTETWHFNQGINITSGSIAIGSATAPSRSLHITATDGLVIPVGTTAQRIGTAIQGEIRYNTTQSTFEGYSGSAWGSLGGVIDVDQDTYVSAETTPGGDNDEIKFFTAGVERGLFCSDGALSIVGATTLGSTLGVTGLASLNGGIAVDTNKFTVADGTGNTLVAGTLDATGDFAINTDKFTVAAATGNTVIAGNLTVDGTTTTVNTAEMTVDDPNITLNAVSSPSDVNASGGGITLLGTTNKTICWTDSTDSWDFNQKISVSQSGTAKADIVLLDFTNPVNAADMDGTTSSIRFNQYYYDATTPATADSAKLTIGTEEDWTSTATTQNSFISFSPACDGTISERMRITSGGLIGINQTVPRANLHIKQLCVPATGEGPLEDHFVLLLHGEVHSGSGVTEDCGKCGHEVCRMSGTDPTSTEAAKFGSKGFLFPASPSDDDRLMIKDCNGSLTWDGDFTLEFWTHICAGGCDFVFEHAPSDGTGSAGADDLRLRFYACDYRICSQGNWLKYEGSDCYIEHDVWFHVAVEREGTCWRMYHDGVVQMHWTDTVFTVNPNGCPFMLGGCSTSGTTSDVLCGYIDEVRISKGCAVYADNDGFDVPTAAYADTGGGDETTYDGLIKIDSDDDTNIFIINDCSCMVGVLQSTPAYNVDITGTLQATTCIVTPVALTTNVGCENTVTGTNAYSFGSCNTVTGTDAYSFGSCNIVDANDSFAIGVCAISCGQSSLALGKCASADTVTGDGSLAFGLCSSAQGNYGIAIGRVSFACTQTVAIGSYAESCGWCGVAVGFQSCTLGCRGIAIGVQACTLNNDSTAIGNYAKTEGLSSVAIGDCAWSTNSNDRTIVIGYCSKADSTSNCTTLVGYCAYTHTAVGATALGFCAEARSACALVLGGCCIGIGISSPTSDLHITGSTHLAMTDTTSTSSGTGNRDIASTAHGLSAGDSVKIPSGGSSAFEKFSVTTVTDADNFVVDSDLTNAVTDVQIYKDSSLLKIDTGDGVNKVTVDKSGSLTVNGNTNLGDGISSDVHTLFGKTSVTASTADYGFKIAQASTGDILQVFDDSTEVFTILDGGNVGISQTTPLCTLDVTGTLRATGNSTIGGTLDVTGDFAINTNKFTVAAATGNTVIAGNLTVDGTTTTVNSTTLTIDDKNIELAHSPSGSAGNDAAVDGGGITLCSTEGNKTILFSAANDSWDFNQKVFVSQAGTAKADIILLDLTNTVSAADMDGTTSSILFNQYYYDASTPAKVDSGKITVGTETDWTSTASTQDSFMSFSTVLDGAVGEKVRIDSAGKVGIGNDLSASGAKLTIGGYVYTHAFTGIGIKQTTADHYGIVIEESASDGWLRLGHTGTVASIDSTTRTSNYTNLHLCTHSNKHISLLTDTGNVGIGTTTPDVPLDVEYTGTGSIARFYNAQTTTSSDNVYIAFQNPITGSTLMSDGSIMGIDTDESMTLWNFENTHFKIGTNSTERMRITSAGNVGIGTIAPTAKLQIGTPTAYSTTDDLFIVNSAGDSRTTLRAGHDATTGDITLNLSAFSSTSDAKSQIWFGDWNDEDVGMQIYDHTDNSMAFTTNASERMRIDDEGNVGIGTTGPVDKLTIDSSTATDIQGWKSAGTMVADLWGTGSGGYGKFGLRNAGNMTVMLNAGGDSYFNGGNVGIGTTTPDELLHIRAADNCQIKIGHHTTNLFLPSDTTMTGPSITWSRPVDGAYVGYIVTSDTTNGVLNNLIYGSRSDHVFMTSNGERFRIDEYTGICVTGAICGGVCYDTNITLEGADSCIWTMGIDHSDSKKLKFSKSATTGISTAMTIADDLMVGIGTESPATILDVKGVTPFITITPNTASQDAGICITGGGSGYGGKWHWVASTGRMEITNNYSNDTNARIQFNMAGGALLSLKSCNSQSHLQLGGIYPGDYWGTGNISFGGAVFHVRSTSSFANVAIEGQAGSLLRMYDCAGTADKRWFQMQLDQTNTAAGRLDFTFINDAGNVACEVMTMCQNGDVGIGTVTPNTRLHVHEDSGANANLLITNESTQQARYGAVQSLGGIITGSSDYAVSTEAEEVSGGIGTGLTVCVTEIQGGKPSKLSIVAEGSNYSDGDYVCITQDNVSDNFTCVQVKRVGADGFTIGIDGRENAKVWNNEDRAIIFGANGCDRFRVSRTGAIGVGVVNSGIPSSLFINADGSGYSTATNLAVTGGSGSNLTVDITASGGDITCAVINQPGSGYCMSDLVTVVQTNASGGTLRIDEIDDADASLHVMGQFRGLFREPSTNCVSKAVSAVADPRLICFNCCVGNSFNHNLEVGDALKLPTLTSAYADTETFTVTSVLNACRVCVNRDPTFPMTTEQEIYKDDSLLRIQTGDNCDSVIIDSSGNLGVNVADPQYKLDVYGKARFRGALETVIGGSDYYLKTSSTKREFVFNTASCQHGLNVGDAVSLPTGYIEGCLCLQSGGSGTWVAGDTIVGAPSSCSNGAAAVVTTVYSQTLLGFSTGTDGSTSFLCQNEPITSSGTGSATICNNASGVCIKGRQYETRTVCYLGSGTHSENLSNVGCLCKFVVSVDPTNTIASSGNHLGYRDNDTLINIQSGDGRPRFCLSKSGRIVLDGEPSIKDTGAGQGTLMIGQDQRVFSTQVNAGNFVTGCTYKILSIGDTDFTTIGAAANTVGCQFVATGVGTGTGYADFGDYVQNVMFDCSQIQARLGIAASTFSMQLAGKPGVGIGTAGSTHQDQSTGDVISNKLLVKGNARVEGDLSVTSDFQVQGEQTVFTTQYVDTIDTVRAVFLSYDQPIFEEAWPWGDGADSGGSVGMTGMTCINGTTNWTVCVASADKPNPFYSVGECVTLSNVGGITYGGSTTIVGQEVLCFTVVSADNANHRFTVCGVTSGGTLNSGSTYDSGSGVGAVSKATITGGKSDLDFDGAAPKNIDDGLGNCGLGMTGTATSVPLGGVGCTFACTVVGSNRRYTINTGTFSGVATGDIIRLSAGSSYHYESVTAVASTYFEIGTVNIANTTGREVYLQSAGKDWTASLAGTGIHCKVPTTSYSDNERGGGQGLSLDITTDSNGTVTSAEISTSKQSGVVVASVNSGGENYSVGDIVSVAGTDDSGKVIKVSVGAGGSGYVVGNTFTISQAIAGTDLATGQVTAVSGGAVTAVTLTYAGSSYDYADTTSARSTTATSGSGSSLTINITLGDAFLEVTTVSTGAATGIKINSEGSNYEKAFNVTTATKVDASSPTGSGLTVNISTSARGAGYIDGEIVKVVDPAGTGTDVYFSIDDIYLEREWAVTGTDIDLGTVAGPAGANALQLTKDTRVESKGMNLQYYYPYQSGDVVGSGESTGQTRVFLKALVKYYNHDDSTDFIKVQFYDGSNWNDIFSGQNRNVNGDYRGWHKLTADLTPFISKTQGKVTKVDIVSKASNGGISSVRGGTGYSNATGATVGSAPSGGTGLTLNTTITAGALSSVTINAVGSGYEEGDIVEVAGAGTNGFVRVLQVDTDNKIRFEINSNEISDYLQIADVIVYESDVPTQLGDVFLGKQKTGIGTSKPNNTLSVANKYDNEVALDLRSNDNSIVSSNYEDFSSARILSESLDDNYSGKKLHFQLPTAENTWKSNLAMYNGCVGIGTCFTATNCLPSPNGAGATGEGLHVLGNIRQNNSSLLQSSSILDNRHEQTLHFDGSGDHVEIADNANLDFGTNDFSIEVWAKHGTSHATHGNTEYLVGKGDSNGAYSITLKQDSDYISTYFYDGAVGGTYYATSGSILDDKWHHIAFSFVRDDRVYMYLDGVLIGSPDISNASGNIDSATALRIGNWPSGTNNFEGEISTVRLFKYALGPDDIRSLYNGKPVDYPEKGSVPISDLILDNDFSEMTSAEGNFGGTPKWEEEGRSVTIAWNKSTSDLPAGYTSKVIGSPTSGSSGSYWDGVLRTNHTNNSLAYGANQKFQASFWAKSGANQQSGDADARAMRVRLGDDTEAEGDQDYAGGGDVIIDTVWRKYYVSFVTSADNSTVRRLEFQVGNSDTPVHLTGVKFTRVGVALELLPEGISSSGGQWYDSSGIDNNGTITNASDKGKYVSPNYGWKSVNCGTNSSAFGYRSCAEANFSTAVGYCPRTTVGATGSFAIGYCTQADNACQTVVGYCAYAGNLFDAGTGTTAIGYKSRGCLDHGLLIGYCTTANTGGLPPANFSVSVGYCTNVGACYSSAFGVKSTAGGKCSTAVGVDSCAEGCRGVGVGYNAVATTENAISIGIITIATQCEAVALGYNASSTGCGALSVGCGTQSSGTRSTAVGHYSCATAEYANAIGNYGTSRIACTTNIGGALIIKKDAGETEGLDFMQFSGVETVLMTKEVDLKSVAATTITLPTGARFWINEMGILSTCVDTLTTQPEISIGITGDEDKHMDESTTVNLTAAGKRERYIPTSPDDGEVTLVGKVTTAAVATSMKGRFYFKGLLVENE